MTEASDSLVGQGRRAIDLIVDQDSFRENQAPGWSPPPDYGPGAVVGMATVLGQPVLVLANDAEAINERFPVVYYGVIGLEEAYKMALSVYSLLEAERDKPREDKTALLLIVDTPGNAPGKVEELVGMNNATGAYQLALAQARRCGHPVVAMVVGRAISGAFLCHGLQASRILALSSDFGAMIHVMPISSIARITKLDPERLHQLARTNPVFAAGVEYFQRLGGVDQVLDSLSDMAPAIAASIDSIRAGDSGGPQQRGLLGQQRGGRLARAQVEQRMAQELEPLLEQYL